MNKDSRYYGTSQLKKKKNNVIPLNSSSYIWKRELNKLTNPDYGDMLRMKTVAIINEI